MKETTWKSLDHYRFIIIVAAIAFAVLMQFPILLDASEGKYPPRIGGTASGSGRSLSFNSVGELLRYKGEIEHITLVRQELSAKDMAAIACLGVRKCIGIHDCRIGETSWKALHQGEWSSCRLSLTKQNLSPIAIKDILTTPGLSYVSIMLSEIETPISPETVSDSTVQELELYKVKMSDSAFSFLFSLPALEKVGLFEFRKPKESSFLGLTQASKLKKVLLFDSDISPGIMGCILRSTSIEILELNYCRIDKRLTEIPLGESYVNQSIIKLIISNDREGMVNDFSPIVAKLKSLEELVINNVSVSAKLTDSREAAIARSRHVLLNTIENSSAKRVGLHGNLIDDALVEMLAEGFSTDQEDGAGRPTVARSSRFSFSELRLRGWKLSNKSAELLSKIESLKYIVLEKLKDVDADWSAEGIDLFTRFFGATPFEELTVYVSHDYPDKAQVLEKIEQFRESYPRTIIRLLILNRSSKGEPKAKER